MHNTWIYILIMALTTFVIRALPMFLIRKPITNKFINSFLYYVPYITLSVMTFPAIVEATDSLLAGYIALIVGIIAALKNANLITVASLSCLTVLIIEFMI